ncbi:MAG: hypothetical protein M3116_05245, partial [Actinomycetota bacterium]|nr:hypothetical protein [Actinomycetota bacterium]
RRLPASVELFVERARAVKPDFELGPHNIDDVERICVALEGVPLAIELAAARIRVLSPASLLERLDRQLTLLVGGRRDLPARQQALRSTIEWSTNLLAPGERELLAKLGVFSGRFSLEAAESVAGAPGADETLGLLSALVDSSLLRQQEHVGATYFSMLVTVREYALEQLEASGGSDALRTRHAAYYRGLAAQSQPQLKGPQQREALLRLMQEHDNLSAAGRHLLNQRDWDSAADLAWRLFFYFWAVGQLREARGWMLEVLSSGEPLAARTRARALYMLRAVDPGQTAFDTVPDLTESIELFRQESDRFGEALALVALSFALGQPDPPETLRARQAAERGLLLFREAGDIWGQSLALITIGRVELVKGNPAAGLAAFSASLELAARSGNEFGATVARTHLAEARILSGDMEGAEAALRDALQYSMRVGLPEGEAYALEGLMILVGIRGDAATAGLLLGASEVRRERAGLSPPDRLSVPIGLIEPLRNGQHADAFERGYLEGRMLSVEEAVARFESSRAEREAATSD